eukprot:Skav201625  [mRNA]  locus=scaffold3582:22134:32432:+ [translate_table: standard]
MAPGKNVGRSSKAKAKPKVAPTRAPKRPSARAPSQASKSTAPKVGRRRPAKRKAQDADLEADPWCAMEASESEASEATEESWDPTGDHTEELSHSSSESEKAAGPSRSSHGPSEADRVYRDLIRRGATPAIVAKHIKVCKDGEPEMELFTPAAAIKAGLIPDQARYVRRPSFSFGNMFPF